MSILFGQLILAIMTTHMAVMSGCKTMTMMSAHRDCYVNTHDLCFRTLYLHFRMHMTIMPGHTAIKSGHTSIMSGKLLLHGNTGLKKGEAAREKI